MFILGIIVGMIMTSVIVVPKIQSLENELYHEIRHSIKLEQRIEELTKEGR